MYIHQAAGAGVGVDGGGGDDMFGMVGIALDGRQHLFDGAAPPGSAEEH
jgi:hypothetical protein